MEEQSQDIPENLSEKERIQKILNDPNTTAEEREDIMCHLTARSAVTRLSGPRLNLKARAVVWKNSQVEKFPS
jgi:hypothetical protein